MARPPKTKPPRISKESQGELSSSNESSSFISLATWFVKSVLDCLVDSNFVLHILFACFLIICLLELALVALDFYVLLYT